MDPITPVTSGSPAISRAARAPVERAERVTRERDRPAKDRQQPRRREPPPPVQHERFPQDDERPHIDVRV